MLLSIVNRFLVPVPVLVTPFTVLTELLSLTFVYGNVIVVLTA